MASSLPAVEEAKQALGMRLREIRKQAGFQTARAFAARAGWSEVRVSRLEHGHTSPNEDDLRCYAEVSGNPRLYEDLFATASNINDMYVEWLRLKGNGLTPAQEVHLPLYERTRHFRVYEPGVIPGLLQTPAYARAIMGRIISFWGIPDDAEEAAEVRVVQKQRVLRDAGRQFGFLLEETALRSRFGDTETMATQLGHLLTVSVLQQVSIGIIPMTADRLMWPNEGFWIFDDDQVIIELATAQVTVKQPSEIATYARVFRELAGLACFGKPARALISAAIDALE
ncbi:helix-turn-helix transcriptional regulator [Streptomyces sp. H27-H1]|uniref:helix-turn-helix domain-containing protein n=1 Tax=unclassified Streptomyces TaxID=2593676 RepID=UPI00226E9318|nr:MULTISPECIES: helix-turn-helix transcriptional regulator [unclassified Streptomyces]MCY0929507.1 helix-turn-helix transcriptional regulator [Streptomyces sp. H27-H1]MCY0939662.1 helix-turn-helix transcriptional regulator [Streptomyces sp. H34-S4]